MQDALTFLYFYSHEILSSQKPNRFALKSMSMHKAKKKKTVCFLFSIVKKNLKICPHLSSIHSDFNSKKFQFFMCSFNFKIKHKNHIFFPLVAILISLKNYYHHEHLTFLEK